MKDTKDSESSLIELKSYLLGEENIRRERPFGWSEHCLLRLAALAQVVVHRVIVAELELQRAHFGVHFIIHVELAGVTPLIGLV